jgi:hypothetical protein
MSDKYDVGYKKPPRTNQFKKGQSGNPKGRPKGVKNLSTDLQEELQSKIKITEDGKSFNVTKQRAMLKTMFAKALKGDPRSASALISLIVGLEQARVLDGDSKEISADDKAILAAFLEQNKGEKL